VTNKWCQNKQGRTLFLEERLGRKIMPNPQGRPGKRDIEIKKQGPSLFIILFIPAMFFAPIKETAKKTGWDTALTIFAVLGLLAALSYMGQLSQLMPKQ